MAKETKKYDEDYLNGLIAKAKKSWEGVDVDSFMSELRDDLIDEEVAEKLSKEVTSHIIEQIKYNMDAVTIKCRDLMIGDLVCLKDDTNYKLPMKVNCILKDDIFLEGKGFLGSIEDTIKPIPLTSEILEKNGWKETEYWHEYKDGNTIIQYSLSNIWGIINGVEIEHFKCEYVHQLQHLLRLCGLNELADNFKV